MVDTPEIVAGEIPDSNAGNNNAELFEPDGKSDIQAMPEPQDHALQAVVGRLEGETGQEIAPAPSPVKGETDSDGRAFDPSFHESPKRLNSEGWIAKKRGRNRSFVASETKSKPNPQTGHVEQTSAHTKSVDIAAECALAGETSAALFVSIGALFLGQEFLPENKDENKVLSKSFEQYFIAKGKPDIPPGIALACSLLVYSAKRWNAPKIAEKRQTFVSLVKRWFNDWQFRRKMARGEA